MPPHQWKDISINFPCHWCNGHEAPADPHQGTPIKKAPASEGRGCQGPGAPCVTPPGRLATGWHQPAAASGEGLGCRRLSTRGTMSTQATMMISVSDMGRCRKDRKSTRLNSSHLVISYAVSCLKKKNTPAPRDV